jgi:lipopolysaccharide export system protein LptA
MSIYSKQFSIIKYIVLGGVLCLFFTKPTAQVRPGQLRQEILNNQHAKTKPTTKENKRNRRPVKSLIPPKPLAPIVNPLNNRNATLVYLENTETLAYDQFKNPDLKILKGNVRFKHDNAYLYCDSAYFYEKANSLDAFSNVRIVQGDTLFVYGDFLYYDGNQKLARLRQNAKMVNRETTLTTDSLNFDRNTNLAYYYTGGKIVDPENTLTSVWGQYNTSTNDALFRNNVLLTNPNYSMNADTLQYNTKTNFANIIGPTKIVYKDETDIFSTKGWYNTTNERMMLLDRSLVKHKDGKTIIGDTIFYDKAQKYGEAFVNVIMTDSTEKSTLSGNYVYYNENTETGLATNKALLVEWSSKDTLWLHADTLRTFKDSIFNTAKGYLNVRLYRNDIQGICDSLIFAERDSIINMYGEPVLWAEENQLSGEFIQAFTKNKKVERVHIQRSAMAVQKVDSLSFNQLSGKEIIAYIDSSELRRVNVNGNAETIYYPMDDADSTLIGLNKTESSYVVMYLKNKKAERIVMTSSTSGVMYPLGQLTGGDIYLKNFFWLEKQRPTSSAAVLVIPEKEIRQKIGESSLMGVNSKEEVSDKKTDRKNTNEQNKNTNSSINRQKQNAN